MFPETHPQIQKQKGTGGGTIQLQVNAPLTVNGGSTSRKTRPQRSHWEFSLPSQHTGGYWFSSHSHPTPSHPGRCIRKPYCTSVAPHHLLEMQRGENTERRAAQLPREWEQCSDSQQTACKHSLETSQEPYRNLKQRAFTIFLLFLCSQAFLTQNTNFFCTKKRPNCQFHRPSW